MQFQKLSCAFDKVGEEVTIHTIQILTGSEVNFICILTPSDKYCPRLRGQYISPRGNILGNICILLTEVTAFSSLQALELASFCISAKQLTPVALQIPAP